MFLNIENSKLYLLFFYKAMITYAETDNRKLNCVRIKVAYFIANGYITNADLAGTNYDPAHNYEIIKK